MHDTVLKWFETERKTPEWGLTGRNNLVEHQGNNRPNHCFVRLMAK